MGVTLPHATETETVLFPPMVYSDLVYGGSLYGRVICLVELAMEICEKKKKW